MADTWQYSIPPPPYEELLANGAGVPEVCSIEKRHDLALEGAGNSHQATLPRKTLRRMRHELQPLSAVCNRYSPDKERAQQHQRLKMI